MKASPLIRDRYLLYALAIITMPLILLFLHPNTGLETLIERFPMFLALLSLTAVALARSHGYYPDTVNRSRHQEKLFRRYTITGTRPAEARERIERGFLLPLDPRELTFHYMGYGIEPMDITSTHSSSISLSSHGRSVPESSWNSQTQKFFRPGSDSVHGATQGIPESGIKRNQS